jgi:hypothetical protein
VVGFPARHGFHRFASSLFGIKKGIEKTTRHWQDFRPAEVEDLFSAQGFSVRASRPQFFFPMVLHRLCRSRGLARVLEVVPRSVGLTGRFGSPVIVRADRD